jgi:hypothetical protein
VPFYAFGDLTVVPIRDLGSAGAIEGTPVLVNCPLRDSFRSIYLWFAVFALLLLRRVNRSRRAWAILLPLVMIYAVLYVAENKPDGPMTWYASIYIRSFVYESLRALALGLALLLAVADLITARSRLVRRMLALAVVLMGGLTAIIQNAPVAMNTPFLAVAFAVIVLLSTLGLGIITRLLHWLLGRDDARWHAAVFLALCVGPILLIQGMRLLLLGGQGGLLSTLNQIIMAAAVSQVVFAPYFVFFCFAVLALLSPLYRQRFAHCFAREATVA